jgi:hypothetical protein
MLDNMTPAEFKERADHYLLEPWGDEVSIASAIGATIVNEIRQALAGEKVSEDKLLPLDAFLPKQANEGAQRAGSMEASLNVMRRQAGV